MKGFCAIIITVLCLTFFSTKVLSQVTVINRTNTTPNLNATYPSLAAAISALNAITAISGAVTIQLTAAQTAPAGGYSINFINISNTAASVITINGNGNTVTAFSPQASGSLADAIFKIIGADYINIQNFVMQENASNTTTALANNNMTEWGVALLYATPINGAQNNTIENNTISLNKAYPNSFGIYSNTRHAASNPTTNADISIGTTGPNKSNRIYGNTISNVNMGITFIASPTDANMDTGNDIGGASSATGNTITNWGSVSPATGNFMSNSGSYHCIFMNHQKDDNISYNTITSAILSGTAGQVRAIFKAYRTTQPTTAFTTNINNNSITVTDNMAGSSPVTLIVSEGVVPALSTASINITGNLLINNGIGAAGSGIDLVGISNSSQVGTMNINDNIFRGNSSTATTGGFTAIYNSGAITTTLNINNNQLGNAAGNAITFSAATGGALYGINCPTIGATAAVSISGNNFRGFAQSVTGTGIHNYITFIHGASGPTTDNISSNTFTNLVANTSNAVAFISRSGSMANGAGATEICSNNSIVTAFSKPVAGGSVILYNGTSGSLGGNTMVQTGNNFSNITLTGVTAITGWNCSEGGVTGPVKTISNNTFSNWTCAASAVNVLQTNFSDNGTTVSNNTISNISSTSSAAITGIQLGSSNKGATQTCSGNIISGLTAGTGSVVGIINNSPLVTAFNINNNYISGLSSSVTGAFAALRIINSSTVNLFKNRIYNISAAAAGSIVYGIDIQSTNAGTCNIYNNLVGDLHAPVANTGNAIRGIMISSVVNTAVHNIYYNSIYLDATSSGTDFGTSGIFLTASSTAVNGTSSLRNNIIINKSVANGTGLTVSYRRSVAQLGNYGIASNNNIFYSGIPSLSNLIFSDGTNNDITLGTYKTRVGTTRDAGSFTENTPFLSTVGASPVFLHIDAALPTIVESNAVNIAGYTDDVDGEIRQGNAGYVGTGTAPDIGADEVEGTPTELNPPVITYTNIVSPACTFSGMTVTNVTITDATGITLSGAVRPRIYYRKNAGSWFSNGGLYISGTPTSSIWNFTVNETDMGGVAGGDIVSYYIIAQDIIPTPNVGSNPATGLVASSVNTVTIHPTTPNSYTLYYNLNGLYTVGVGGNFTTLTAAVNAYNTACALTGAVIFELTDNTYPSETYPVTINNHPDANIINTLTIRPSATATPLITGAVSSQIIAFNGARFITLEGRQGGSGMPKSFTITNTNTSGNTIQFVNDARSNRINYCVIKGSSTSGTRGVINFGMANVAGTGNDDIVIDNNDICDGAGDPANAIFSSGRPFKENSNISITNNNIFNHFKTDGRSVGININANSSNWIISGNRFYQTTSKLITYAADHFDIWINAGAGYTVENNIIGYANASGTGSMVMVGNSVPIAGFPTSYSAVAGIDLRYIAINCNFEAGAANSTIDGNTIAGIAMYTSSPGFSTYGIFCGIYVEDGNVSIGSNAGNIIGSTTGTASIYCASTSPGATFVGIRVGSTGIVSIQNNSIGGIMASGTSNSISAGITGISTGNSGIFNISNNRIGNNTPANMRMGYITSGVNLSSAGTLTATSGGTAAFVGITSGTSGGAVNITGNTLQGWATSNSLAPVTGILGSVTSIFANPAVTAANNFLGTAINGWINYTVPNSGALTGIKITNINFLNSVYAISNNDIRGITCTSATPNSGTCDLINVTMGVIHTNTVNILNNTLTDLTLNTTGSTSLISLAYNVSAAGVQNVTGNSIVGNFNRTGTSGNLYLVTANNASVSGAQINHNNNDFSNITVAGTTSILGFQNYDGSTNPTKKVNGNICSNWTAGTGVINVFDYDYIGGAQSSFSNNVITNIHGQSAITCIRLNNNGNATTLNVTNNTINGLVSSGTGGNVNGISLNTPSARANLDNNGIHSLSSTGAGATINAIVTGGAATVVDLTKNKIYDIAGSHSASIVNGIHITAGSNVRLTNNYIGDLRSPVSGISGPSVTGLKISGGAAVNSYYNTIHINASSSAVLFSSAAVFVNTATTVSFRNNIFSNISVPGAGGRTVAYWRSSTNLSTYDPASNTNLFYVGTGSPQRLIYFDGSNSDQLFSDYQARVSSRDDHAVSELPVFTSTSGADATFLHLDALSNCGIFGKGDNAGIGVLDDYDGDPRSIVAPLITDIGADEKGKLNTWTGNNGTSWNDIANWSGNSVPDDFATNVIISSAALNQPIIGLGEAFQVSNITIATGALLTNLGTLKISGTITSPAGGINHLQSGIVTGSIELNGNCSIAQIIAGSVFFGNQVNNLTITNNVNLTASPGEQLQVTGTLSFGAVAGKTFNTGDNLVLVSGEATTANVADLTGNFIVGKATVERYVNTGLLADGRHLKSWQFLSTPTVGQTIFQSWQESATVPAGYGTIITGTGTGFDITTATASIKYYNYLLNNWTSVSNTGNPINNSNGYMLFVRGDRTVTAYNQAATPTRLRTKGTLYQPSAPPPVVSVQAGQLASVGNPYASAINLIYMKDNGRFVNLNNDVTVWDPLLAGSYNAGGYQTLSAANNYEPTAGSTSTAYYQAGVPSPYIQSGQAFFVRSSGPAGSVTFNEACKESSNRLVNRVSPTTNNRQYFRTTLFTEQGTIADGNAVVFDPFFSNSIDADDAYKQENAGENFALNRYDKKLAVEARRPVYKTDTIFYDMKNLRLQPYQLRFAPKNMQATNLTAFLIDKYLHTSTNLSLTDSSFVNILINNDPLSQAADRFYVVFKKGRTPNIFPIEHNDIVNTAIVNSEPVTASAFISMYPNPVTDNTIYVRFVGQPNGLYKLELKNSTGQQLYNGMVRINTGNITCSIVPQAQLAAGNYLLVILSEKGTRSVQQVMVK